MTESECEEKRCLEDSVRWCAILVAMRDVPECEENTFDGLHCPRWYHGGSCSYCGAPQPRRIQSTESAGPDATPMCEAEADAENMRAEFEAWVQDRGCDTDGAWSAWQGAWNLRLPHFSRISQR